MRNQYLVLFKITPAQRNQSENYHNTLKSKLNHKKLCRNTPLLLEIKRILNSFLKDPFLAKYCTFDLQKILFSKCCCLLLHLHGLVGVRKRLPLSEGEWLIPKIEEDIHITKYHLR